MEEIIRFEHISFSYEAEREALIDFSAAFHRGEKIAVLGNNGAGKSTLFLLANGVLKPQSGKIFFENSEIRSSAKDLNVLRRGVGLVFQDPDVQIIAGSVEEEISFGPMNLRLPEEEISRRVDSALAGFSLEALRTRAPQYLSGGEKKRVTLADAAVMEPKLLLLDEPFSSLDRMNAVMLEKHLDMLSQKGLGLVIATHDMDFTWRWATRVLILREGRLVADCTPEAAFADKELLSSCGLCQPMLYRIGRILRADPLPRTITELEEMLNR